MSDNVDHDFVKRFLDWYSKALGDVEKGVNLTDIKEQAQDIIDISNKRIEENISKRLPIDSLEGVKNDMFYLIYRISEIE